MKDSTNQHSICIAMIDVKPAKRTFSLTTSVNVSNFIQNHILPYIGLLYIGVYTSIRHKLSQNLIDQENEIPIESILNILDLVTINHKNCY